MSNGTVWLPLCKNRHTVITFYKESPELGCCQPTSYSSTPRPAYQADFAKVSQSANPSGRVCATQRESWGGLHCGPPDPGGSCWIPLPAETQQELFPKNPHLSHVVLLYRQHSTDKTSLLFINFFIKLMFREYQQTSHCVKKKYILSNAIGLGMKPKQIFFHLLN